MSTLIMSKKRTKPRTRRQNRPESAPSGAGANKPGEFERYGLFMALPMEERKEIFGFTQDQQFAKAYGVSKQTLSEWKWDPKLWDVRDKYLIVFKKYTARIIAALGKRAERTGEAFHSLSFLKVVEGFTEKTGLDLTSKGQKIGGFKVVVHHAAQSPTSSRSSASGK